MDITKLKIRKTPHDHGNHAMSYFGVLRIGSDRHGNPRFMCLQCNEVWTEDGNKRMRPGYWHCPNLCNQTFFMGIDRTLGGPNDALTAIPKLWEPFTEQGLMWDYVDSLYSMNQGTEPRYRKLPADLFGTNNSTPIEFSWKDDLANMLDLTDNHAKVKPGHFGTELALNAVKHYVAHLWAWYERTDHMIPKGECGKAVMAIDGKLIAENIDHEAVLAKAPSFTDGPALHQ